MGRPEPVAPAGPEPFAAALARHDRTLVRAETRVLQVNVGLVCNQACRHCHLEAGPDRTDQVMDRATMDAVIAYAARCGFAAVDVTGGAPELVPEIEHLLEGLRPLAPRLLFRSNLTALADRGDGLAHRLRDLGAVIVTSLPSVSPSQTDALRGRGVADRSVAMLRRLNELGYGRGDTGLELDLVSNPAGAFLPPDQCAAEKRFRTTLSRRWGIAFNHLYTFANVPLGRFRRWLASSGNLDGYLDRLAHAFNPATVDGLMCRSQVTVRWDGALYDCDFNLARDLPLGGRRIHVDDLPGPPPPGLAVATGDHCYACTAGSGFT